MDELREAFEDAWDESVEENTPESETLESSNDEIIEGVDNAQANPENQSDDKQRQPEETGNPKTEIEEKPQEAIAAKGKAPASWSPKNREHWAKLPPEVQSQVAKRESEVNKVLQESSTSRRAVQELNQTLAPYQQGLQQAGYHTPMQAISTLLQTENGLRTGDMHQRATQVAKLIQNYGIDIQTLDSVLSGQTQQNTGQRGDPNLEAMIDQRMAPVNQFLQQQQQQQQYQQQQQHQEATNSVTEFGSNAEFINEVRMDMADLLDMASNRNQPMTLQQAYDKACAINPEVSQVMSQRQQQQQIMGTNNATAAKKAASVSLTGNPAGGGNSNAGGSLRDTIAAAWNDSVG